LTITVPLVAACFGVLLCLILLAAAWVSRSEGEGRAAWILALLALPVSAPFALPLLIPPSIQGALATGILLGVGLSAVVFLLPLRGGRLSELGRPAPGVDERDTMFSRDRLVPGTARYAEYYRARPEARELDNAFRREPGLLSSDASLYHPEGFAAAEAAFWTIEMLRPFVEGEPGSASDGAGGSEVAGNEGQVEWPEPRRQERQTEGGRGPLSSPAAMARFLKEWALKMGAHSVGVTDVKDYHLYACVGRGADYGKEVDLDHSFAVAITVEMDKEMVGQAPKAGATLQTAYQYLRSGVMAVQMADTIRRLGYRARAHIDGRYRVICPLVARDAGLGELGRMGLLMTPRLGPRVRIAVVTTDLPLAIDGPSPDPTVIDFCLRCKKCADCCPSRSISFEPPEEDENGVLRWRIDSESCFTLWTQLGTDCARCMAVCPYSHDDNAMHAFVRWGIRNNVWFRRAALGMDDFVYGRNPRPKEDLEWMKTRSG
jgi:reductive dehalogenase